MWGNVRLDAQGRPEKLVLADARRQLLLSLPDDIAVFEAAVPPFVRDLLEKYWFDNAWKDAVNFDVEEREAPMFFRNLPVDIQQEAKAYAERKGTADAALQFAQTDFIRWADDFFTLQNERTMVRPLANVLGHLQADDDIDKGKEHMIYVQN